MARSPIETQPHWELPPQRRIVQAKIKPRFLAHFTEHHTGLNSIALSGREQTRRGSISHGTFQKFRLDTEPDQQPSLSAEYLARLVWLAAERLVRKTGNTVSFRFFLRGTTNRQTFNDEGTFSIKPQQILGPNEESHPVPEEDEEDEEEEEEEEEEEDDDEEESEEEEDPHAWNEDTAALVPVEERIEPATGIRHPVPMQLNPHFVVSLQNNAISLAQRAYEGSMNANRGLVQEMRAEMSSMIGDLKGMSEQNNRSHLNLIQEIKGLCVDLVKSSNERIKLLEERLGENAKLSSKQYENLQELAKQGWVAFLDAMKMKSQVVDERIEWTRWAAEEVKRIQPPAAAPAPEGGGMSSLLREAGDNPLLMGGLAMLMRKMGNNQGADFLEEIARNTSKRGRADDEEDEEEEEDVYDVPAYDHSTGANGARPNGSNGSPTPGRSPFVGQPHGPSAAPPTPFADRVRRFRARLDDDTYAGLRKALSKKARSAFDTAVQATDDEAAKAAIRRLKAELESDTLQMLALGDRLTEDQVSEIMSVIEDVRDGGPKRGRRPPPRPSPTPSK